MELNNLTVDSRRSMLIQIFFSILAVCRRYVLKETLLYFLGHWTCIIAVVPPNPAGIILPALDAYIFSHHTGCSESSYVELYCVSAFGLSKILLLCNSMCINGATLV
jgi:hypothetical protein